MVTLVSGYDVREIVLPDRTDEVIGVEHQRELVTVETRALEECCRARVGTKGPHTRQGLHDVADARRAVSRSGREP
jgi:hypothetical protein